MKTNNACPFCSQNSVQVLGPKTSPNTSTHALGYQVECVNCGARGPCGMINEDEAIAVWDQGIYWYARPAVIQKSYGYTNLEIKK